MFEQYILRTLLLVALCSGLPLLVSCLGSFLLAALQAATQIQEQGSQFLLKWILVSAVLALSGSWMLGQTMALFQDFLLSLYVFGKL